MAIRKMLKNSVGSITIDVAGVIKSFDAVAEQMFGYSSSEVINRNVTVLMPEPYSTNHDSYLQRYLSEHSPHIIGQGRELPGKRKDGSIFPMWLTVNHVQIGDVSLFTGSIFDLSAQKKAERDLSRSEAFSKAVLDTAVNPIITIDAQGLIRSFNRSAEVMLGYTQEEVIDKNVHILMPEPYHSKHDGYLQHYMAGGEPRIIGKGREVVAKTKSGKHIPIHLSVGKMDMDDETMFVGIMTDISEQKAVEQELLEHRGKLEELVSIATKEVEAIVETAANGVITIDEKGTIKVFNPSAEKLFGWPQREVIGQNVTMLMGKKDSQRHASYIGKFLEKSESSGNKVQNSGREIYAKKRDGTLFPAYIAIGHRELKNNKHLFVAFIRDISVQKEKEQELKLAKELAEQAAKARSAFLANMSHEIRTPMNAIIGFSELVQQSEGLNSDTKEYMDIIVSSSKSLLTLINDILDVSKLDSGQYSLDEVNFNLPNALAEAMKMMEYRATEKGLKLVVTYDTDLPKRFIGDPHRLRQVLVNLVGNAIKFTERGQVSINVNKGSQPQELLFEISDTGIGMSPDHLSSVFEPFSQADNSISRRFGGTGLGTTICKQIIELMHGRIWAESEQGVGTQFYFTCSLPIAEKGVDCLYEDTAQSIDDYVSPRSFHILVAEDIPENATLVILRLERQGHFVSWAKNGLEAVELYKKHKFDLILMDVMMPEMDGLEATKQIRQWQNVRNEYTPIVALTASVLTEEHNLFYQAGMDAIAFKPIDFASLFSVMESLVPVENGNLNHNSKVINHNNEEIDFSVVSSVADVAKALKNWCDPSVYANALLSFAGDHAEDAVIIEQLFKNDFTEQSKKKAYQITHALKGVAANLMLFEVMSSTVRLNNQLKKPTSENIYQPLQQLSQSLASAVSAIHQLAMPKNQPNKTLQFDNDIVNDLLKQLIPAIERYNPDAVMPILDELSLYCGQSILRDIKKQISLYDFDAAAIKANQLIQQLQAEMGQFDEKNNTNR